MFNDLILQKYFKPDKRIIYNILPLLDKKGYIATILPEEHTSNANIVITRSLKSNVWKGPIDNSAPDKESVIVDLTYDKTGRLYGVGMKIEKGITIYNIYKKEKRNSIKCRWVPVPSNENIRSIGFDLDKKMMGCHGESGQIYKRKTTSIDSDWEGPINYDIPMKKVIFDKDSYLLGIGMRDGKIYKKKGFFWAEEKWDTEHVNNESVFDLVHDKDGTLIGTTAKGIKKQVSPNYISHFKSYYSNGKKNKQLMNFTDIMRAKTGLILEDEHIIDDNTTLGKELKEILKFKSQSQDLCKNKRFMTSKDNKETSSKVLLVNKQSKMIDELESMVQSLQNDLRN